MKPRTFVLRFLLSLCLVQLGVPSLMAQDARGVLKASTAKLKSLGGIKAAFEATAFSGLEPTGVSTGTICIEGQRFRLQSPQMQVWYDGQTLWSMPVQSGEVYISTPTSAELQTINPYKFLDIYKSGYSLSLSATTFRGLACHEVRLVAQQASADIAEMRIVIDKATHMPLSVRIKQQSGGWVRIRVGQVLSGQTWGAAYFQYDASEFPDVEVVDLR